MADFSGADFSGLDFSGLDIGGTNFSKANLTNAYLQKTNLRGARLAYVLPWRLAVGIENEALSVVESLILGVPPFSWLPVLAVMGLVGVFTAVSIHQFQREEF
ncbi:MAG: pentapeptide repeat-containing protein [Chloroflexi bacterium]|nr:pentapeptide repeat-containing protein [Chloroflexota bacterium]